jgi:hypothetical protein
MYQDKGRLELLRRATLSFHEMTIIDEKHGIAENFPQPCHLTHAN